MKPPIVPPICPYCEASSVLVPDTEVYARGYGGQVYLCRPCRAWVGCHKNSKRHAPLGRLANQHLRTLKVECHAAFDRIWRAAVEIRGWTRSHARLTAYAWLAKEMDVEVRKCHIGYFDDNQVQQAIEICRSIGRKKAA
jgi:hypothetical protein